MPNDKVEIYVDEYDDELEMCQQCGSFACVSQEHCKWLRLCFLLEESIKDAQDLLVEARKKEHDAWLKEIEG